jgi:integrase
MSELINRENYCEVLAYLDYQERIKQCSQETISRKWCYLRHLLEWAGSIRFFDVERIRLTFPNYLLSARNDGKNKPLSPVTNKRNCLEVKEFFRWARIYKDTKYKTISEKWIDTLRISKARTNLIGLEDRKYYSEEEILSICNFVPQILIDKRDRAAIALLFLSAMRITAFMTLPISCVDIEGMTVFQLPQEGMRTKNNKAAETTLLPIDQLLKIVKEWDQLVRQELGTSALWYPNLSTDGLRWSPNLGLSQSEAGRKSFRRGLKKLCARVNIEYKSSHKIRRGHGVFAVKHSKNYEEFQAYSQNMGHEDPGTTFKYYSRLSKNDVRDVILRNK